VHQVCDWYGSAVAKFGWMRDARRANTRCGLQPTSNKAPGQNPHTALRVGAAPAPRGVAGSLKVTQPFASPAPCEAIRRRSQRSYTSHRLGALGLRAKRNP
jgi:hypothetical protein